MLAKSVVKRIWRNQSSLLRQPASVQKGETRSRQNANVAVSVATSATLPCSDKKTWRGCKVAHVGGIEYPSAVYGEIIGSSDGIGAGGTGRNYFIPPPPSILYAKRGMTQAMLTSPWRAMFLFSDNIGKTSPVAQCDGIIAYSPMMRQEYCENILPRSPALHRVRPVGRNVAKPECR